jgi:hypothetical protein
MVHSIHLEPKVQKLKRIRAFATGMSKQTSYSKIYRPDIRAHPRLP